MGNRAVITTKTAFETNGIGIYLHWNGGRDSVEGFLAYCKMKGYRTPGVHSSYAMARLVQVISNFFGGTCSIGIDCISHLDCDNGDNGVYIIDGDWEIVGRRYHSGTEQNNYPLINMLQTIDERMPAEEQLGEFITAPELSVSDIKIGDTVLLLNCTEKLVKVKVIGIGEDKLVNGTNVMGIPYVDMYVGSNFTDNINNYLTQRTYRVIKE